MSRENVQSEGLPEAKKSVLYKRKPKKIHPISDEDIRTIMAIAEKAKRLRESLNLSYEGFAAQCMVNRNSYFRFEQSARKGENFTVALLLKVIRGLNLTPEEFFKDIR